MVYTHPYTTAPALSCFVSFSYWGPPVVIKTRNNLIEKEITRCSTVWVKKNFWPNNNVLQWIYWLNVNIAILFKRNVSNISQNCVGYYYHFVLLVLGQKIAKLTWNKFVNKFCVILILSIIQNILLMFEFKRWTKNEKN